jgi:hypothetical protein
MADDKVCLSVSGASETAVADEKVQFAMDDEEKAQFAAEDEKKTQCAAPGAPTRLGTVSDAESEDHLSRRLTWKCDLRLVPILGALYFTAFLDRNNIANARLEGFEKELQMPSNGYNTALWTFYLSFVLFESPLNLFMNWQKIKPRQWLGGMMFCLGKPNTAADKTTL